MKSTKLRTITAAVIFIVLCVGLIAGIGFGTLSGFGWDTIALLCPLGALTSMIAAKTLIPKAVISLVIMAALIFIFGRAFCAWICPTQLFYRLREFFRSPKKRKALEQTKRSEALSISKSELKAQHNCASCGGSCGETRKKLDSRHFVLGGALLSTAVFGFPIFCLVCPIGLSFATVLVFWRLFFAGDITIAIVLIPLMLIIELVFLRKWCTRFCPLAGLMNLVSRFSKTWRPVIDDNKCLETSKGTACGRCAEVCEADINLRHPNFGERTLADCTRCRACVDVCPSKAVSMPFLNKSSAKPDTPDTIEVKAAQEQTEAQE